MKKNVLYFLASAFVLQGCTDPEERTAEYMESGQLLYEQENYSKAKIEFKNALQINDKLGGAYYHLALIAEKDQAWKKVFANLQRAVKLSPSNHEARLKLAQIYLLSGSIDKAQVEVDTVLASVPDNLDAIALNGALLLKQKNYVAALLEADKVLAVDAKHNDAISLKVVIYMAQEDYVSAESVINKAIEAKPNDISLNLLRLQLHTKSKNKLAIEQDYKNLIKIFPDKHEFSYTLAKYYVSEKRDSEALALLRDVVAQNKELIEPKLVLIDYLMQKNQGLVEQTINQFIQENPDEIDLYFRLASFKLQKNQVEDAKKALNWVVENKGESEKALAAKTLLAKLAIQEKNKELASTLVTEVLAIDAKYYDALLLQARMILMDEKYDEAVTKLRSIIRDYSKSDEAMVLLAQTYIRKGSPELADENFRKALDLNPSSLSAAMPVAASMARSKDLVRADEVLQTALKSNPTHEGALKELSQVRLINRDWLGTLEVAKKIALIPDGEGFSLYLEAKVSQGQGAYADAIAKYKRALSKDPSLADALKNIVISYEKLKQRDKILAFLNEFIQQNPEDAYPVLLKARLYGFNKDWGNALTVLHKGVDQWPEVTQFYALMANVYRAKNESDKVIEVYKKGLEKNPNNVSLSLLLASVYEKNKEYTEALAVYESLAVKHPDVDVVVNNMVALLVDYFPSTDNFQRAEKLAKRFEDSDNPYFLDTYGWALLSNGKFKESIEFFAKAVSKMPRLPVFQYHLGVAYHKNKNTIQAINTVNKALEYAGEKPGFIEKPQAEALLAELKGLLEKN